MLDDTELDRLIDIYEPDDGAAAGRWRIVFDANAAGALTLVNRFTLRDRAVYDDGREASGLDAFMTYAATSVPAMERVGGRFLVSGPVLTSLFGQPDESHLVVVGWYPDRGALLALLRDPAYQAAFAHRRAALASQSVIAANAP